MSPAGGRRRLTRGVFSIEDQQLTLPDPIALDTSFVVEALLATQPLHDACDAFLKRIFDSGVSVVTSELHRARRDGFRHRHEGTLGRALASTPHRRTLLPACRTAAERHHLAL
jgi:predicted nucleic acid-binding protein